MSRDRERKKKKKKVFKKCQEIFNDLAIKKVQDTKK